MLQLSRWAATVLPSLALLAAGCSVEESAATPVASTAAATTTPPPTVSTPAATSSLGTTATATPSRTAAAAGGTVKAVISGFKLPNLTVKKGTTVEFVNQDSAGHTATADDPNAFSSPTIAPNGGTFSFTADTSGTFPYACLLHPTMAGVITVQ